MPAERHDAAGEPAAAAARVVAVAALDFEAEPLRRRARAQRGGPTQCRVHQSGPGPGRAAAAAAAAVAAGAAGLVSWGVAGALSSDLAPGAVIVPRVVRALGGAAFPTDGLWQAALAAALGVEFPLSEAELVSTDAVLETPASKTRAAAATGAAAVDMESAAIASVAARAGVPFVAVRVIVDAATDTLPKGAERWVDAAGNRRMASTLAAAVQPSEWGHLWQLARRYRVATRTLERLAARLAPAGFLLAARG